jgi:hypothetical protein
LGVADEEVADEGEAARGVYHRRLVPHAVEEGICPTALLTHDAGVEPCVVEPGGVRLDGEALDAAEGRVLGDTLEMCRM